MEKDQLMVVDIVFVFMFVLISINGTHMRKNRKIFFELFTAFLLGLFFNIPVHSTYVKRQIYSFPKRDKRER